MLLYDYTGIDDSGKPHKGQLEAENEKDLEKKLAGKGYYLLEAKEARVIVKVSSPVEKAVPIETKQTAKPSKNWKTWVRIAVYVPLGLLTVGILVPAIFIISKSPSPRQAPRQESQEVLKSQKPEPTTLNISFQELDNIFGPKSSYTDYQKNILWKDYKGKFIIWNGIIEDVSDSWFDRDLYVGFKHSIETSSCDAKVFFPPEYKPFFKIIKKGDVLKYKACLEKRSGSGIFGGDHYLLYDGSIVK